MGDWGRRLVPDLTFDQVSVVVLQELQRERFEVLGTVDVRDALRRSLKADLGHTCRGHSAGK